MGAWFFEKLADPKEWQDINLTGAWRSFYPELLGTVLVKELENFKKNGLCSHFLKTSGKKKMQVKRVGVFPPESLNLGSRVLNKYPTGSSIELPRLLPLEVVFRFGIPAGSSFTQRLNFEYAKELGFSSVPSPGSQFEAPIIEFFTKLEDTDRFLTWEQALHYADLETPEFLELVAQSALVAAFLKKVFAGIGVELWGG